ncbi:nucleoside monophosphate kinase [Myxococcota bacterium]|nr:nucleoside monophosphate kinase [Myxococcota bacterium]
MQNIVVTGKSGAGKQPRIDVLVSEFGLTQLSTGNIFRHYLGVFKGLKHARTPESYWDAAASAFVPDDAIRADLAAACDEKKVPVDDAVLGLKAARFVDAGLFVPDSITNALFEGAFLKHEGRGLILDGYPRTADQSQFLLDAVSRAGTSLDAVLIVDNEDELIIGRTVGRRICPSCQKVFHLEFKPPRDGHLCTACGAEVIHRSDDTEDKIRTRLAEFQKKTLPAIGVLTAQGIPQVRVPGNLPVFTDEIVRASVLEALSPILK